MVNVLKLLINDSIFPGSWIGSILAIGALVLAIPIGMLAEAIGRKLTLLSLVIFFMLNWLLIIFANGPGMMYAARFFAGVGTGMLHKKIG